ncbi:hypothetical protein N9967_01710 [bacterium]|nr:hypothetical protein [bacterium]
MILEVTSRILVIENPSSKIDSIDAHFFLMAQGRWCHAEIAELLKKSEDTAKKEAPKAAE